MGPRKYHCEYCDKSFQDNRQSRRRHLRGLSHQRCKKDYFDLYMVPSASKKGAALLRSGLSGPEILQIWMQNNLSVVEKFKSEGGIMEAASAVGMSPEPSLGTSPLFPGPAPMLPLTLVPPPAPLLPTLTTPPAPLVPTLTTPPAPFAPPPVLPLLPPQGFSAPPTSTYPAQPNPFSTCLPPLS